MHLKLLALAAACACTLIPSALAEPGVVPPPMAAWAEEGPAGVTISWQRPVADPGLVAGYLVFREGQLIASVTDLQYVDSEGNSTNVYEVSSFDDEGHHSVPVFATMVKGQCLVVYELGHILPASVAPLECIRAVLPMGGNLARTLNDPPILDD